MTTNFKSNSRLSLINKVENKTQIINKKTPQELLDIISKQGLLTNFQSGGNFNPDINGAGLIKKASGAYDVITPEGGRYLFTGFGHFLKAIKHSEQDLNLNLFE